MWALRGTVVTMDDAATVHRDGVVWIGGDGRIAAVGPSNAPPPPGFAGIDPLRTGATIYPGLIDLHNHIPYNTIGLWREPTRAGPYTDHGQWVRAPSYGPAVSKPAGFLGWVSAPSLLAYVEMKAIVGGTTTVQGNGKVNHTIDGALARNIDSEKFGTTKDFFRVQTIVPDSATAFTSAAQAMINKGAGFICHVAEGVDPALGAEWAQAAEGGVVRRGLVAIHGTALTPAQLAELAAVDATLVWSPFSNLWLYGGTLDVAAARAAGVRLCLGSDWAPSGTKHVLGELKVAAVANGDPGAWRQPPAPGSVAGPLFSDLELCRMVTSNPGDAIAAVAGPQVGRLQPGWLADLVVVRRAVAQPYRNLIRAVERDVRLVVVGGEPRYGTPVLMASAGATGTTALVVAGQARHAVVRSPQNAARFLQWPDVVARLTAVREHPEQAARELALALASVGGDLSRPEAPLVVFGDMPLADGGTAWSAGRNDPPLPCPVPELQSLTHDAAWFDAVDANPFHRGLLSALRGFYT